MVRASRGRFNNFGTKKGQKQWGRIKAAGEVGARPAFSLCFGARSGAPPFFQTRRFLGAPASWGATSREGPSKRIYAFQNPSCVGFDLDRRIYILLKKNNQVKKTTSKRTHRERANASLIYQDLSHFRKLYVSRAPKGRKKPGILWKVPNGRTTRPAIPSSRKPRIESIE